MREQKYQWRNILRADTPKRSVTERIADFLEIGDFLDEMIVREQAGRCLQCLEPPCVDGCPMKNRIPEWLGLVEQGHFQEASELLSASGCMPEIVCRLCRQRCEEYCVLEKAGEPISINAIERFLNHYAQEHQVSAATVAPSNGKRVAVVGSGPCGLACCLELVRDGLSVTVYDSHATPGGFLVQGIPAFRLEKGMVQRRIEQLKQMGVAFRMNVKWRQDITLQKLRSEYDAVFLGPCAEESRPLTIPGAELRGVFQGLDFIIQKNFSCAFEGEGIEVRNKQVAVLGGGDTAMDCLRTAIRCGAREAVCLYRREQASMPCQARELLDAIEEGARVRFSTLPIRILGNSSGQVEKICCVRTQAGRPDPTGRPEPVPLAGSEFEVPADVVLVAHGVIPPGMLADVEFSGLRRNEWGGLAVDEQQMTALPGVFAAGVLVRPCLLLTEAARDARTAAQGIKLFLRSASAGAKIAARGVND